MCIRDSLYCDQRRCPYALDYYERLPEALSELYRLQIINPESLLPIAKKHRLCPFELSLDVSSWCDVIICDYNYVYDPRVRLQRFFADVGETYAILVDEAHNLPSRAREMYSARLELDQLTDVYTCLLYTSRCRAKTFRSVTKYRFSRVNGSMRRWVSSTIRKVT